MKSKSSMLTATVTGGQVAVGIGVNVLVGGMGVNVLVGGTGVNVLVGGAAVKVAVGEPHGGCVKMSARPEVKPPVLHSNCVFCGPTPFCTPTVALLPVWSTGP